MNRKRISFSLAMAVLGGIGGLIFTWIQPPTYEVNAQVIVVPQASVFNPAAIFLSGNTPSPAGSLTGLFNSRPVVVAVAQKLNIEESDVAKHYFVVTDNLSGVVSMQIEARSVEQGIEAVNSALTRVREIEKLSKTVSSGSKQAELSKQQLARQNAYDEARKDYLSVLKTSRVPYGANATALMNLGKRTIDLQTQLSQERSQLKALQERLRHVTLDPDLPKGEVKEADVNYLETIRQGRDQAKLNFDSAKARLGPQMPEYVRLKTAYDAAQAAYLRELKSARNRIQEGIELTIRSRQASVKALEFQVAARQKIQREAPQELVKLTSAYRKLTDAESDLSEASIERELAKLEGQGDRVRWLTLTEPWSDNRAINKRFVRNPLVSAAVLLSLAWFISPVIWGKK